MKSVRVVVPLAIRQFVIEVFVEASVTHPALPGWLFDSRELFFDVSVTLRTNIGYKLVLRVTYSVSALVCVIASPTMSASISAAVRLIDHWPLPSCAALLVVVP